MMSINTNNQKVSFLPFKKTATLPETQEEFEVLLDKLRPKAEHVEVIYQYGDTKDEIGALVYTDGALRHVIDPSRQKVEVFNEEVNELIRFYKHPPRLWPGCRGAIARKFGLKMTVQYNRWFDEFANAGKKSH